MTEWWTYRLQDLLMFAPRTYYRLFELYHRDVWPAQLLSIVAGLLILMLLLRRGERWQSRVIASILALAWFWVGWAFLDRRYATINWAARWFAVGFVVEATLLVWTGVIRGTLRFQTDRGGVRGAGLVLYVFALMVQPLIGPLADRSWTEIELFGMTPDPTAVATLALLLLASERIPWPLMILPGIWCVISASTLWAMRSPEAFVGPAVLIFVFAFATRGGVITRRLPNEQT